ncbi:glycosyltransferase [Priestia taiwanensis]|uniref:Glycosyl transferase n=1 Tax=Priestia taiwanensis TaxID=1347902 RepID=A0A917EKL8_9BACI|nr:glycosyltransferase [Priestia taiwanensis]MBM7361608.1 glycosyltransferase involved in cell wall biosynthesis [Priestia taiwanensis]GGE55478.1 glycosyl transferase [Priestia taiwanensis]
MKNRVCMFVWNHFTNDARVLRECSALAEEGYEVDLIAIHDRKNKDLPKREMREEGFTVIRVNNSFPSVIGKIFGLSAKIKRVLTRNYYMLFLSLILFIASLWFMPLPTMVLGVIFTLLVTKKIRTFLVRGYIAMQMVMCGMRKKYDIYHSNDLNTLPQGLVCAKLFRRKKLVYDSHEVQTSRTGYNSKIYGKMEKLYIKFIDVMINENHTRAKYTEDLYGIYPEVVHNYPFVSRPENSGDVDLHRLLNIPKEEPILLYQGGIQTGRGLDKLIQATPNFKRGVLVFIGDGRIKPELEKMVHDMQLEDKVRFLPKVPVNELLHYTKNAYLGFQVLNNICFNHYSASSNKLFEYMMSGVPVVACSFPEIQGVVEKENTGLCVDSHNPISIAEGVNYLLDHPEVREQMSENCFSAREKYNWEQEKKQFLDVYKKVAF